MKSLRNCSLLLVGLCALGVAIGPASAATLAIEGGTVHPVSGDSYRGTVVIDDGRITAAGPDATVPSGATRIDATGLHVYPGIFDAQSQVGMVEIGAVDATDDRSEMGGYNAHLEAASGIHPASELIRTARSTGITHAMAAPRPSGRVGGRTTLIHLDGWTVEEMAIQRSVAMSTSFPSIQTRSWDWSSFSWKDKPFNEAKDEAKEEVDELRDWLDAARHYQKAMAVDKVRAARDLRLAHLGAILDGGMPVIIGVNEKRDIEAAVEFAEKEGLSIVLSGASGAHEVAQMLAEKGIGVILGGTARMPADDDDPYDLPYRTPGLLANAGVKIAFASGVGGWGNVSPHSARTIPFEASMAVGYGLDPDDALKALTLWPAQMYGVDDVLGSIDAGKIANLVVTDGDLLDLTSQVRHLVIDGREVDPTDFHRELYEKYRAR